MHLPLQPQPPTPSPPTQNESEFSFFWLSNRSNLYSKSVSIFFFFFFFSFLTFACCHFISFFYIFACACVSVYVSVCYFLKTQTFNTSNTVYLKLLEPLKVTSQENETCSNLPLTREAYQIVWVFFSFSPTSAHFLFMFSSQISTFSQRKFLWGLSRL